MFITVCMRIAMLFTVVLHQCGACGINSGKTCMKIGLIIDEDDPIASWLVSSTVRLINNNPGILKGYWLTIVEEKLHDQNPFLAMTAACDLIDDNDMNALISFTRCKATKEIRKNAMAAGIPHMFVMPAFCRFSQNMESTSLAMSPEKRLYDEAVTDIIQRTSWTSMVVFYDNEYDFNRLETYLSPELRKKVKVSVYRIRPPNIAEGIIKAQSLGFNVKNAVVLCGLNTTFRVIQEAINLKVITRDSQWIVLQENLRYEDIPVGKDSEGIITIVRPSDKWSESGKRLKARWKNNEVVSKFPLKNDYTYLHDAVYEVAYGLQSLVVQNAWVRPSNVTCGNGNKWTPGKRVIKHIKTSNQQFDGIHGRISFTESGWNDFAVMDVMSMETKNRSLDFEQVANWRTDREQRLEITKPLFSRYFTGFNNRSKLQVVTLPDNEPFVFYDPRANPRYTGFLPDMMNELARRMNVSYEIYNCPDGKYGAKDSNGTWNGMIGELVRKDADIALATLGISAEREKVVDFTKPYMEYSADILLKRPEAKDENEMTMITAFLRPFETNVWITIFGCILAVGVLLHLLNRFGPYGSYRSQLPGNEPIDFNLVNSVWFAFATFWATGVDSCPRSPSSRILSAVWWFFTLIVISTYTANLAAYLTVTGLEAPIASVDDLAKQTEIGYGTVEDSNLFSFFKESKIGIYETMYKFMNGTDEYVVSDYREGIRRVKESNINGKDYAFMWDQGILEYVKAQDPDCKLMTVKKPFNERMYGIALQVNAQFRDAMSIHILKMQEEGFIENLRKKWWKDGGRCAGVGSSTTTSLPLSKMAGVFYCLGGGIGISLLCVGIDVIWNKMRNRYCTKRRSKVEENPSSHGDTNDIRKNHAKFSEKVLNRYSGGIDSPDISSYDAREA
ncbi:glutamate receptor ionotropic, delta-1-like [Tubulanus polymorphus]|uniref:glutamate receptor ionotropic, delta-1-like n=1 Tax=Tubulanus polymorphus TaxID=672921 RepID=UPI003DA376EA